MNDRKTTNILLLIIVIPLVFYLLKILSFIFIPLVFSMFIALLFLPFMRWMKKKRVPKPVSIAIVIAIIVGILKAGGVLIKLTSNEILAANGVIFEKAESKFTFPFAVIMILSGYPLGSYIFTAFWNLIPSTISQDGLSKCTSTI